MTDSKCNTCIHKTNPKTIKPVYIDNPCYACLFNQELPKTNNYVQTREIA